MSQQYLISLDKTRVIENYITVGLGTQSDREGAVLPTLDNVFANFNTFVANQNLIKTETFKTKYITSLSDEIQSSDYDVRFYKDLKIKSNLRKPEIHESWPAERVKKTVESLLSPYQDLFDLYSLVVRAVVLDCLEGYASASSSDAVGVISINCRNSYHEQDIGEMVVHELAHNVVFIDNLVRGHFLNQDSKTQPLVFSPIRETERSMIGAVHALVVAAELLNFRKLSNTFDLKSNVHPSSESMIDNCKRTLATCHDLQSEFTQSGWDILNNISNFVETIT